MNAASFPTPLTPEQVQTLFGQRIAAHLQAGAEDVPADISERLRAARVRALAARGTADATAVVSQGNGSAALGGLGGWLKPLAFALPAAAIIAAGWLYTQKTPTQPAPVVVQRSIALAEVDMLMDDVPPRAYADAAFVAYLEQDKAGKIVTTTIRNSNP